MKVRMLVGISGTRSGAEWPAPGGVLECSNEEGADLCAGGLATPLVDDGTEKAVVDDDSEKRLTTRTGPTRRKS